MVPGGRLAVVCTAGEVIFTFSHVEILNHTFFVWQFLFSPGGSHALSFLKDCKEQRDKRVQHVPVKWRLHSANGAAWYGLAYGPKQYRFALQRYLLIFSAAFCRNHLGTVRVYIREAPLPPDALALRTDRGA